MNFRQNILLDPFSSLFGGGGSSSSSTATNQQVGAQGNYGPVFGAITTKGNTARSSRQQQQTSTSTNAAGGPTRGVNRNGSRTSTSGLAAGNAAPTQEAPVSAGAGNVNISVETSDLNANNNLTTIAEGSITAQNDLAQSALGLAATVSAESFGIVSQVSQAATSTSGQALSDTSQALENFGAVEAGANPNQIVSPTGGAAVNSSGKTLLVLGLIGIGLVLIFKK